MLLTPEGRSFVTDYHLASLSTLSADGSIHAVPVGFTLVDGIARVITRRGSQKVRNIRERGHATISQVEGGRWITLIGAATVLEDAESVAEAVELYARRYRQPQPNPERVAVHVAVQRVLASPGMLER